MHNVKMSDSLPGKPIERQQFHIYTFQFKNKLLEVLQLIVSKNTLENTSKLIVMNSFEN